MTSAAYSLHDASPLSALARQTPPLRTLAILDALGPQTIRTDLQTPLYRPRDDVTPCLMPKRTHAGTPHEEPQREQRLSGQTESEGSNKHRGSSSQASGSARTSDSGPFAYAGYETTQNKPETINEHTADTATTAPGQDGFLPQAPNSAMPPSCATRASSSAPVTPVAASAKRMTITPVPGGRVRTHTSSGQSRNFSRPSTYESVTPESSPPRPRRTIERDMGANVSVSPAAQKVPSEGPRLAATAPTSAMQRAAATAAHLERGADGAYAMAAFDALPQLTREPSATSSHDPMTPASMHRQLSKDNWDPRQSLQRASRAKTAIRGQTSSFGTSVAESEDEKQSTSSSGSGASKWKFWVRKSTLPKHDAMDPDWGNELPLSGLWTKYDEYTSPLTDSQVRLDGSAYVQAPNAPHGAQPSDHEGAAETLKDNEPLGAFQLEERAASQLSYYSYRSDVSTTANPILSQSQPMPLSSRQTPHLQSSSDPTEAWHHQSTWSMQKAKATINGNKHLHASRWPITEPKRRRGDTQRPLSADDPEDCLHLGIDCHERGELERSAMYFERSAKLKGGCGQGMLLWGLTLRHGWGCSVDPAKGFSYLQKAAETVVGDLDSLIARSNQGITAGDLAAKAAKAELVLSIYELGMSFRKGWGVKKDKAMALSYFELASTLGDPDAQQELGFAYLHGKGTKKDKAKAAHYYRLAAKQGVRTFGDQWIWKEKYGGRDQ